MAVTVVTVVAAVEVVVAVVVVWLFPVDQRGRGNPTREASRVARRHARRRRHLELGRVDLLVDVAAQRDRRLGRRRQLALEVLRRLPRLERASERAARASGASAWQL